MPSELLSHRLVNFRDRHGLTLAGLAELLGVTPRYLSYLEAGTKEIGPESSLYKLFIAYDEGHLTLPRSLGEKSSLREEPGVYRVEARRPDSIGSNHAHGLTTQDALAQVRSDLAMLEGGSQADKRRAYYFLREVHLPMLAQMLKLE